MGERTVSRRTVLGLGAGVALAGTGLGGGAWYAWDSLWGRYVEGARLRWSVTHDLGRAQPVLAGDTAILLGDDATAGLDADTGAPKWRRAPSRFKGGASAGDRVLVPDGDDGTYLVIAAADGSDLWRTPAGLALTGVAPGPGERLYAVGSTPDGHFALAIEPGGVRWRVPLPDAPLWGAGVAVAGDGVVVHAGTGGLYCLAAADGARRWHADPPDDDGFALAPLAGGGVVVALSASAVVGYDAASGKRRWRYDSHKPLLNVVPPAADGTVAFSSGHDGEPTTLTVLDGASGDVRWRRDDRPGAFAIAGSRVCLATDNAVVLLDAHDARTAKHPLPVPRARLATDGRRLLAAADGTLTLFDVA